MSYYDSVLSVTDDSMKLSSLSKSGVHVCTNVAKKKISRHNLTHQYHGHVEALFTAIWNAGRGDWHFFPCWSHSAIYKVIHTIKPVSGEALETYIYSGKIKSRLQSPSCSYSITQHGTDTEVSADKSTTGWVNPKLRISQEETCLFLTAVLGALANRVALLMRSFLFRCYKPTKFCFLVSSSSMSQYYSHSICAAS